MDKKIKSIVTGGAGFIGSNLVDRLVKEGHQVIVIDNFISGDKKNLSHHSKKIVKIINLDIVQDKKLNKYFYNVDYVFHLAGLAEIIPSIKNPKNYFINNVLGTLNVLEACKNKKIKKFVYAASSSCYGNPKKFPTSEDEKVDTKNPYAMTKFLGEELVMKYATIFGMPNVSFRFFNVYGPRLNTSGQYGAVFSNFLKQKKNKKPLTIVGNGNQTRDFIYVEDLIDAFLQILKNKKVNEIYNLGSGKETSINKIAQIFGGKRIFVPKRLGEPKRSLANISKIRKDINWTPKISIEEGIKRFLKN
ncbi:MAG: NAD-dependent epimerase/dehydratase family protein [Proteobacteria bacterium]|nr:NAD-dependent epimerase/dehydratase family protein [Pseudomonadota bacterium]